MHLDRQRRRRPGHGPVPPRGPVRFRARAPCEPGGRQPADPGPARRRAGRHDVDRLFAPGPRVRLLPVRQLDRTPGAGAAAPAAATTRIAGPGRGRGPARRADPIGLVAHAQRRHAAPRRVGRTGPRTPGIDGRTDRPAQSQTPGASAVRDRRHDDAGQRAGGDRRDVAGRCADTRCHAALARKRTAQRDSQRSEVVRVMRRCVA